VSRTLVDRVTLLPDLNELRIVLRGDLAAILSRRRKEARPSFGDRAVWRFSIAGGRRLRG